MTNPVMNNQKNECISTENKCSNIPPLNVSLCISSTLTEKFNQLRDNVYGHIMLLLHLMRTMLYNFLNLPKNGFWNGPTFFVLLDL